jgi:two-component system NarL family sensor kinase
VVTDITRQREAELAQAQLSRRIINAQEQERQRVARDLHDGVNQLLVSAKFRLNSLVGPGAVADEPAEAGQVLELIEKAIHEVRLISRNLRPSELDDLGLVSALRTLAHDFRERSGIATRFKSSVAPRRPGLPKEIEMTLYRIAQEALNNAERHSQATRVGLVLKATAGEVSLSICDNGKGFVARRLRPNAERGWGLQNMCERAALVGGRVDTVSRPNHGTTVTVQIPFRPGARRKNRRLK